MWINKIRRPGSEVRKAHTTEYLAEKFRALQRLTGNAPLLSIHFRYGGTTRSIYAKSEQLNMTGSIKDRVRAIGQTSVCLFSNTEEPATCAVVGGNGEKQLNSDTAENVNSVRPTCAPVIG